MSRLSLLKWFRFGVQLDWLTAELTLNNTYANKGNWPVHVWTMTDNGVNKRHEGSHLHLQPCWPNNTQQASQPGTHTNTHALAGGVVVWAPLQSICCPVRRWTWGEVNLRGNTPSIAHVQQQGVECVWWLRGKPRTETWILTQPR